MSEATTPAPRADVLVLPAAALTLLLWSGTPIANKIAVAHLSGVTAGTLRSLLAAVIAVLIALSLRLPFPAARSDRTLLALSGMASFVLWPVLMSLGLAATSATHAALIMAVTPVFTVLISAAANRSRPRSSWWLGATVAIAGAAVLVVPQGPGGPDTGSARGDLLVLLGVLACATGYVSGARLAPVIGAVATTFWGLALALPALAGLLLVVAPATDWAAVPANAWLAIAWMTVLSSLAGYALWFFALGRGGVARIGSLQLGLPVLTLAAAAVVLDEALTPMVLVSAVLVVAGTWVAHAAGAPRGAARGARG